MNDVVNLGLLKSLEQRNEYFRSLDLKCALFPIMAKAIDDMAGSGRNL